MKQQLVQVKKVINASIDEQVKNLIRQLNKTNEDFQKKQYMILCEIIRLRKKQIKGYSPSSLSHEKGINLTTHQIQYLFGYRYISEATHREIDKGNLKTSTALWLIRQNMKLREEPLQNKAVKMYLDGKMNTSELGMLGTDAIEKDVISNKIEDADRDAMRIIGFIEEIIKRLTIKRNLFTERHILIKIKRGAERIIEKVDDVLNNGEGLK